MVVYSHEPMRAVEGVEQTQAALFIDFENIAISAKEAFGGCDLRVIIETAGQRGRCVIKRAYGDWTHFEEYRHDLLEHSIETIQMFRYGAQKDKNAADIQMATDILETVFIHPAIGVFVLATGDSDFSAVARKLREYGKLVVGIGLRRSTSEVLVNACDQFVLYDNLVEPETRTLAFGLERGRQLLLDAMHRLTQRSQADMVLATQVKIAMQEQDPTFNEVALGFSQFKSFLESQADLLEIQVRGERGTELAVTLRVPAAEQTRADGTLQYRRALDTAGLRLLDPHTRTDILWDLFRLLSDRPGQLTLDEAVQELKAEYDVTNVLRSRDEIQAVARLLRRADVLEPRPRSWELDRLTLKSDLQPPGFVDQCESAYIASLLEQNLPIDTDLLARLLFGTVDQRARVERLDGLARAGLPERARAAEKAVQWEWPRPLSDSPEFQVVRRDLEECTLDEKPTVDRAAEFNRAGLRVRTTDFERARGYFLNGARMIYELLLMGQPGASPMDLEWYLASYCAATAGASFFRYDYPFAAKYYLAFFALARETEPVWDKVHNLVRPMLSYYQTIAANENGELLDDSPGTSHPARIAMVVSKYPNPKVRERWGELVRSLVRVNPTVLRMVVQTLQLWETSEQLPGTQETRAILTDLLHESD